LEIGASLSQEILDLTATHAPGESAFFDIVPPLQPAHDTGAALGDIAMAEYGTCECYKRYRIVPKPEARKDKVEVEKGRSGRKL
jgi:hypothetical protein